MLHFDEETFLTRFEKVQGFAYNLSECLYTVTPSMLKMPFKKLKAFPGSNRKCVGPHCISANYGRTPQFGAMEREENIWSAAAKLACKVGGAGEEGLARSKERTPETVEPVCFHA